MKRYLPFCLLVVALYYPVSVKSSVVSGGQACGNAGTLDCASKVGGNCSDFSTWHTGDPPAYAKGAAIVCEVLTGNGNCQGAGYEASLGCGG